MKLIPFLNVANSPRGFSTPSSPTFVEYRFQIALKYRPRIPQALGGIRLRRRDPLKRFVENANNPPLLSQRNDRYLGISNLDLRDIRLGIPGGLCDQIIFT